METEEETVNDHELAKGVVKFVVGKSVGFTVAALVKTHVPTTNRLQDIELMIGAYTLASMVADKAVDRADEQLDNMIATYRAVRQKIQEQKTSEEE